MVSSTQHTTNLITTYWKLNKKCSRYETIHYDVIIFSHKQLSSKFMNSIPVSLFPTCISIEMAQRVLETHAVSLDENRWKKKVICGFPSSLCAHQNIKSWTRIINLQFFLLITVAECFCVEANNQRMQVLNHSSLGLRIFYYFYWAKTTTVP